ncbi:MAG: hypothetical protein V5786_10645 [Psychromonas sp.]
MSLLLSNGKSQGQRKKINALEKLGGKPPEAIYVGDNPINDYIGSKKRGMTPIWFSGFIE